jgi:hypothetical protein
MIEHKIAFDVPLELAQTRVNVVNWLQSVHYKLATPPFLSDLVFERGSGMGNATAVNPQKWRSTVTAAFRVADERRTRVELAWKVVTAGQLVAKSDIDYWRSEVAGTQTAAAGNPPDLATFEKNRRDGTARYLLILALLTLVVITPILLVLILRKYMLPLYALSAVLAFATYFAFRAPRKL